MLAGVLNAMPSAGIGIAVEQRLAEAGVEIKTRDKETATLQ